MNNIKKQFKNEFAKRDSRANHVIHLNQFVNNIYNKLSPVEQQSIEPTIQELVNEDFITLKVRSEVECMVLTENGFLELYPINEIEVISKLENMILAKFRNTNSKVGHVLMNRWITQFMMQKLNPREKDFVNDAINSLIKRNS